MQTTAPIPPPKPGSHDASRRSTPATTQSPRQPPLPSTPTSLPEVTAYAYAQTPAPPTIVDPGDTWLPKVLQDKSKQDLFEVLASQELLSALTHSASTIHPSVSASYGALQSALDENMELAKRLQELEARLAHQRSATQAQLLGAHALEHSWRAKQAAMDAALAPFAPASLYQQLAAGVNEQEQVCQALEESFLEGEGDGGLASEREASEWVRRYRDARKLFYLRQERKERWDEGRVGGWR
ncbi:hypothetical protein HMPREF1624_06190 [Sporothrix schenckii ATCC 58251]|uniref:VPS37 C-terminal domain-containing protein n=2 Tax=Sporothrix schenckii TaxID=29908 RepID=U7PR06_SPOS1|nr:hypothetical protein HMPREF1624_06190 [Sporothrix schenckii ATCC 58251]